MAKFLRKLSLAFIMCVIFFSAAQNLNAACNPVMVTLCAAVDDTAIIWVNSMQVGSFTYVNWNQAGYPKCITFAVDDPNSAPPADPWDVPMYDAPYGANIVAIQVQNTNCCEVWGSWSMDILCDTGAHAYMSSDDGENRMYNNYATPGPANTPPYCPEFCLTPPPNDGALTWWHHDYTLANPWPTPIKDTGTIWGKQIYHPGTGALLRPLSYDSSGTGEHPPAYLYMRQAYYLTPAPTPLPPFFTITKSVVGDPLTVNTSSQDITYILQVCNTGQQPELGKLVVTDRLDPALGFAGLVDGTGSCGEDWKFGPNSCDNNPAPGYIRIEYPRGFPGGTCLNVTIRARDWWIGPDDFCKVRYNYAGVHWPSGDFTPNITPDAASNTVNVTMYCPGTPTFTLTVSETWTQSYTRTITMTKTATPTVTMTSTRTRIPTWTNSPTEVPTGSTITVTLTRTLSATLTPTMSWTPSATPTVTVTYVNIIALAKSEDCWDINCEVPLGDTVIYCITFTNLLDQQASFTIWDTIPDAMNFVSASDGGQLITWNAAIVPPRTAPLRGIVWSLKDVPPVSQAPYNWGTVCFTVWVARISYAGLDENSYKYAYYDDKKEKVTAQKYFSPARDEGLIRGPGGGRATP